VAHEVRNAKEAVVRLRETGWVAAGRAEDVTRTAEASEVKDRIIAKEKTRGRGGVRTERGGMGSSSPFYASSAVGRKSYVGFAGHTRGVSFVRRAGNGFDRGEGLRSLRCAEMDSWSPRSVGASSPPPSPSPSAACARAPPPPRPAQAADALGPGWTAEGAERADQNTAEKREI